MGAPRSGLSDIDERRALALAYRPPKCAAVAERGVHQSNGFDPANYPGMKHYATNSFGAANPASHGIRTIPQRMDAAASSRKTEDVLSMRASRPRAQANTCSPGIGSNRDLSPSQSLTETPLKDSAAAGEELNALRALVVSLTAQHTDLIHEVRLFKESHAALAAEHAALCDAHNSLQRDHMSLRSEFGQIVERTGARQAHDEVTKCGKAGRQSPTTLSALPPGAVVGSAERKQGPPTVVVGELLRDGRETAKIVEALPLLDEVAQHDANESAVATGRVEGAGGSAAACKRGHGEEGNTPCTACRPRQGAAGASRPSSLPLARLPSACPQSRRFSSSPGSAGAPAVRLANSQISPGVAARISRLFSLSSGSPSVAECSHSLTPTLKPPLDDTLQMKGMYVTSVKQAAMVSPRSRSIRKGARAAGGGASGGGSPWLSARPAALAVKV